MSTHATKVAKSVNNKYAQKLVDTAKTSATDELKIDGKKAIQKTVEASGDLVGNFNADKITSISKKPASEPHSNAASNKIKKERYIERQKRQKDKKLLMN